MPPLKPYPFFLKFLDTLLVPFMYVISGTFIELPQETHTWNLLKLPLSFRDGIDETKCVRLEGSYQGRLGRNFAGPLFHFPVLPGVGWRDYIVLEADTTGSWSIGWDAQGMSRGHLFQISRLSLTQPQVRVLKPPVGVEAVFFGFDVHGAQVPLKIVGEGRIGDGTYPRVRLL